MMCDMDPHFVFNALANIDALMARDVILAKTTLFHLSRWLRTARTAQRDRYLPLGKEMDAIGDYLSVQRVRFGERLKWAIDVPSSMRQQCIPSFLVHQLVDHAVRYGIEPKLQGGRIAIVASIDCDQLSVAVLEDYSESDSLGLDVSAIQREREALVAQLRTKLHARYPEDVCLEIRCVARASAMILFSQRAGSA